MVTPFYQSKTLTLKDNKTPENGKIKSTSQLTPRVEPCLNKSIKNSGFKRKQKSPFYQIPHFEIFLYSAYLDAHNTDHKYIRIFGVQNRTQSRDLQCAVYTGRHSSYQLLKVHGIYPAYSEWPTDQAIYLAYQYGYHIPDALWTKIIASERHMLKCWVVRHDAISIPFEVLPQGPLSKNIASCVRSIWGSVDKYRLIEWIEFQKLLGVADITFYSQTTDQDTETILEYYERKGMVTLIEGSYMDKLWSYVQSDPMGNKIRHKEWLMEQVYLVNINDCLYKYSKTYKFVLLIDIDEFLIPSKDKTLTEMINRLHYNLPLSSAYIFPAVWHFTEFGLVNYTSGQGPASVPNGVTTSSSCAEHLSYREVDKCLHSQNYLRRTSVMHSQPKSIIVSGTFITANWHGINIVNKDLDYQGNYAIDGETYGILHHYRDGCKYNAKKCRELLKHWTIDEEITKYKEPLAQKFLNSVNDLHKCFNMSLV